MIDTMKKTLIIGIAGASGSGKSLLARTLVKELGSKQVVIISEDAYYKDRPDLSFEERAKINYDHPDAFEHSLLRDHLHALKNGETIQVPCHDYAQYRRAEKTITVGKHSIIVLEGVLLFVEPQLREMMDIRIFMDTPADICFIRRLQRDIVQRGRTVESVIAQYQTTVRPMYLQFVEPSKRYADMIVPKGGENLIAIDMIKAKMKEMLTP